MHLKAARNRAAWQRPPSRGEELAHGGQCPRRGHTDGHLLAHFSSIFLLFKTASFDVDALMLSHI